MKILLLTTPSAPQTISFTSMALVEPLALEYVGACVQKNHDVNLVDLRLEQEKTLNNVLEAYQPDIVACSAYTTDVFPVRKLFSEVKKHLPGVLTVTGGIHATMIPSDFMEKNVDVIVVGEGVTSFKKVCECFEKKMNFDGIEDIYFRKNRKDDEMIFTGKKHIPSLDNLPFPARDLTTSYRKSYQSPQVFGPESMASVRGSYGCVYNCKFCSIRTLTNRRLYKRSIDNILEELKSIEEPNILWVDDEFFLDPDRVILMAREIEKAGIKKKHLLYGRADHMVNRPDCVEAWAKIGLLYVMVGLEFHNDKYLKEIDKGYSEPVNKEAVRIMHANHVKVRGGFIVHPGFEKEDFKQLAEYVRNLDIDFPNFFVLTPLPGTKFYEDEFDRIITNNYNLFDCYHTVLPTKLPMKKFYKEYINLFSSALSFKNRMKMLKQMTPKVRWKIIKNAIKMIRQIKNAHRHYS